MTRVVLVHGFQYDNTVPKDDADSPAAFFQQWELILDRGVVGWGWYSVPLGARHVLRAWAHGRGDRYAWAWDLAADEARKLQDWLAGDSEPVYLIGHSLGARVILGAVRDDLPVAGVLLLNGAEHLLAATRAAAACPSIQFLNFAVKTDNILSGPGAWLSPILGKRYCVGQRGLRAKAPPNWVDFFLDGEGEQAWGRQHGYDLRGDNPASWGDHHYSMLWKGNHRLYRDLLDGKVTLLR